MRWTLLCWYALFRQVYQRAKSPQLIYNIDCYMSFYTAWVGYGHKRERVGVAWLPDATDKALDFKVQWSVSWKCTGLDEIQWFWNILNKNFLLQVFQSPYQFLKIILMLIIENLTNFWHNFNPVYYLDQNPDQWPFFLIRKGNIFRCSIFSSNFLFKFLGHFWPIFNVACSLVKTYNCF